MIRTRNRARGGAVRPPMPNATAPQIIASNTSIPNAVRAGNTSGRTDVQNQTRGILTAGRSKFTNIRLGYAGFNIPSGAQGYDATVRGALEVQSPPTNLGFLFSAASSGTLTDGTDLLLTDALNTTIYEGQQFFIRKDWVMPASTNSFPDSVFSGAPTGYVSPADTTQVGNTGAMTVPVGGTAAGVVTPSIIIGMAQTRCPSAIIIGDSLSNGSSDLSTGPAFRALNTVDSEGFLVPTHRQTRNGMSMQQALAETRLRAYWPYATHILLAHGVNDLLGGRSAAQLIADAQAMINLFRAITGPYGVRPHITMMKLPPNTTGTFTTEAGQTINPNFGGVGGNRYTYHAQLDTWLASGFIDAIIDPNTNIESVSTYGKWQANKTTDGTHWDGAIVATDLQPIFNTWRTNIVNGFLQGTLPTPATIGAYSNSLIYLTPSVPATYTKGTGNDLATITNQASGYSDVYSPDAVSPKPQMETRTVFGKNGIEFTASANCYLPIDTKSQIGTTPCTVLIPCKADSAAGNYYLIAGNTTTVLNFSLNLQGTVIRCNHGNVTLDFTRTMDTNDHVVMYQQSGSQFRIGQDGVWSAWTNNGSSSTYATFAIGRRLGSGTSLPFDGVVGDIHFCGRVMRDAEVTSVLRTMGVAI